MRGPQSKPGPDKLTDRQRDIWTWMIAHQVEYGRPATIRAIGDAFDIRSTNGVMRHLNTLSMKGYVHVIESKPGANRTYYGYKAVSPAGSKKITVAPDGRHVKLCIGAVPVYLSCSEVLDLLMGLDKALKEIDRG